MKKLVFLIMVLMSTTCFAQNANQQKAECAQLKRKVDSLLIIVEKQEQIAIKQRMIADSLKVVAFHSKAEAEQQRAIANVMRDEALKNAQEAKKQKQIADSLTQITKQQIDKNK